VPWQHTTESARRGPWQAAAVAALYALRVRLAYDDAGSGECVVLVHGHPFDRTMWERQVAALRGSFRVIAPDLRGFGASPVTPGRVLMRDYAADIEELLSALGVARAAAVGLSMGGLVVMELAAACPERYWALGLVATTAEPPSPRDLRDRDQRADAAERDGAGVLADYMRAGLYGPACPPAVRARAGAMMAAAPPAGAAAALRGRARRPDYRPLLAALDIPALVVAGTADPWSSPAVTAEIVSSLRRPELVVIDDCGHLPNMEAEQEFNAALLAFLRRHVPWSPGIRPGLSPSARPARPPGRRSPSWWPA
jgi:3-oxoadipate enol-lactonase